MPAAGHAADLGEGGRMTDTDLFVLAPWIVFACGVAAILVMGLTRSGRGRRAVRRRPRRLRRPRRR